ncbi:T9SS type A sorting domain-containing protein [Chryseobacterium contaminans]|uniref:T9SS type A sorting domain-containing protein n=1 Tax=Chryseobacterium contaminans TaxID=1423959 RepID=UPI003017948B
MKKKLIAFSIFLIGLLIIKSQTPINASLKETNFFPGFQPSGLLQTNNTLIFAANNGYENKPYHYNLQTETAKIIKDNNGYDGKRMLKNEFYKINNKVYYFASDNSNFELWSIDLSTNITSRVKDFNIPYYSYDNIIAKVLNNKLYFIFQENLYVSDGTTNGTFHINNVSNIGNYLQESNGYVFFFGENNVYGRELWKTDGSVAGTTIVKDINGGNYSSIIYGYEKLYSFNNKIVFVARDSNYNLGLWSTDGTYNNTVQFHSLNNNPSTFYDFDFKNYSTLLFKVNGNLWKTDGTSAGTNKIYDNIPNINKLTFFKNKTYIDTNTNIYYVDQSDQVNTLNNSFGGILQTIAPSNNGNYLALKEYNNESSQIYFFDENTLSKTNIKSTSDNKFIEYQNRLIFPGYIDSYIENYTTYKNTEFFSYNPSTNISKIEKDLVYAGSGTPRFYTELNGEVYFLARDGYYFQVYKVDTNNNLIKLSNDLQEYLPDNIMDYSPITVSGNHIYFHSNKLIRTDAIANSTQQISPPANEKIYGTYSLNDNKILIKTFNSSEGYMRIWSMDNNSLSFSLLIERPANIPSGMMNVDNDFVKTDSGIYFKMMNNSTTEIWKSDGTVNNTIKITDLNKMYQFKGLLGLLNNKIFFSDHQTLGSNNTKLYYIDEVTNQVNLVKDSYYYINGESFVKNNKLYFFSATNNGFVTALHVTDGTPQNTQLVTQINSEGAYTVKKCGNLNYFLDYQRQSLFRTDGTAAGSFLVTTGTQGYSNLSCMYDELYGISSSQKVFKTNGNAGNYQELNFTINNQVLQQTDYTWIRSLYAYKSKIYFSIHQYNNHGEELFITDQMNTLGTHEENIINNNKILIYPNPTETDFNIKVTYPEKVIKVMIYDVNGRLTSTHNSSSINVQKLLPGIYFLNITTNLKKYQTKLIKK